MIRCQLFFYKSAMGKRRKVLHFFTDPERVYDYTEANLCEAEYDKQGTDH